MGFVYPDRITDWYFNYMPMWISALRTTDGEVKLYVLERVLSGTTIILLPDGVWYSSDGQTGILDLAAKPRVIDYTDETTIEMQGVIAGENLIIRFAGENTKLNDDEDVTGMNFDQTVVTKPDYANIITDNLLIDAIDSGDIYESKDPLVVKPFSDDKDKVEIQIFGSVEDDNGAYGGAAYLRTLVSTDVELHDTAVAPDGKIDLNLHEGELKLTDITVKDDGSLNSNIREGGRVILETVTVEGDVDQDNTDGRLTVATASGPVIVGKDNGLSTPDVLIGGTAIITTGKGDITMDDTGISGYALIESIGEGNIRLNNTGISGQATVKTGKGNITADNLDISGTADVISGSDGNITLTDLLVSETGDAEIRSDGNGNIKLTDSELNGDAHITTNGAGNIQLTDIVIDGTATISNDRDLAGEITGNGRGAVDMDNILISGEAIVSTGRGDVDMDVIKITQSAKLDLDTGAGHVTMGQNEGTSTDNTIIVDGTADIFSGTGTIALNKISIGTAGWLDVDTGSLSGADITDNVNDVIADDVQTKGRLNIKTTKGDLLMADDDAKVVLYASYNENESAYDIGGDIGAADLYFKTGYAAGEYDFEEKSSLTLNIINVQDAFLTQLTDIETVYPGLDTEGRLEGADEKTVHDEAISDLGKQDIRIPIAEQTPEELAARLAALLNKQELLELIGGKLTGEALRKILVLREQSIAVALSGRSDEELAALISIIAPIDGPVPETKATDVSAMATILQAADFDTSELTDAEIEEAYENYYAQKRLEYLRAVAEVVLSRIEEDLLTEAFITAALSGKSDEELAALVDVIVPGNRPVPETKETDIDAMAAILENAGIDTSDLTEAEIEEVYESYYAQKQAEYLRAVATALLNLIEEDLLTEASVAATLSGKSDEELAALVSVIAPIDGPVLEERATDAGAMATILQAADIDTSELTEAEIEEVYENYYAQKQTDYLGAVAAALLNLIEDGLLTEESVAAALSEQSDEELAALVSILVPLDGPVLETKETDAVTMATILENAGFDTSGLTEAEIEEAYESYYGQKQAEYRGAVTAALLSRIENLAKTSVAMNLSGKSAEQLAALVNVLAPIDGPVLETKETDVSVMAAILENAGIDTSGLTEAEIEEVYENYYAQKQAEYLSTIAEVLLSRIAEGLLTEESIVTALSENPNEELTTLVNAIIPENRPILETKETDIGAMRTILENAGIDTSDLTDAEIEEA